MLDSGWFYRTRPNRPTYWLAWTPTVVKHPCPFLRWACYFTFLWWNVCVWKTNTISLVWSVLTGWDLVGMYVHFSSLFICSIYSIQHLHFRLNLAFFAHHSVYATARYMPSPVRPSIRPSVRLSVTRVNQSKTVEVRITQTTNSQSRPMTLVSWCLTSPWNFKGKIWSGGAE